MGEGMIRSDYSNLKQIAQIAKARMKSGYWINRKEKLRECLESQDGNVFQEDAVKQYFKASNIAAKKKTEQDVEDEKIYKVVCQIIDEDDGLNPLGRLIDRTIYDSLDDMGKQRYIFELSEKYQRLKQRYLREKEIEKRLSYLAKM